MISRKAGLKGGGKWRGEELIGTARKRGIGINREVFLKYPLWVQKRSGGDGNFRFDGVVIYSRCIVFILFDIIFDLWSI